MNNTRAVQWRDLRYRSGGTCDWTQVENRAPFAKQATLWPRW